MIQRVKTKTILSYLKDFPCVALLGARQVGKTTIAKSLTKKLGKPSLYLDLERPSHAQLLTANPEAFLEQHKDECIIIDEVQRMPSLFSLLRFTIDDHRIPGRFLLLGSANPTLMKGSSESLAGRVMYTELHTLNLLEVHPEKDFYSLWLYGGFPEAFLRQKKPKPFDWHLAFLITYFERDLPLLNLNVSPDLLRRTFALLAHMQGSICNISKLSNTLGIHRKTVERIVLFFTQSYMIRKLAPFFINVKKRLVKSPKYYIRDSGVLHHTLSITTMKTLFEHPILGSSWEGVVIEQIDQLNLQFPMYFYRTQAGAECDLVLTKNNEPLIAIEAKMSDVPKMTKSFATSIEDLGTKENYIIIPNCNVPYTLKNNVMVCSLPWLLTKLFAAD